MSALGPGCVKTLPKRCAAQHLKQLCVLGERMLSLKRNSRINISFFRPRFCFYTAWTHSGHRLDILNTLFLSAYLYQSIIEVLRLFAKFHE